MSLTTALLALLLLVRIAQRAYYFAKGHGHHAWNYRPSDALEAWVRRHNIVSERHAFYAHHDGVAITYRTLGTGPRAVLLANGVGTDLHMWLATLAAMQHLLPDLFQRITLFVPAYRGLFEHHHTQHHRKHQHHRHQAASPAPCCSPPNGEKQPINISIPLCAQDMLQLRGHAKVPQFHTIVGWSTGAQVALACCQLQPSASRGLFLLNPSTGHTLHTFGQAVARLPDRAGAAQSRALHALMRALIAVTDDVPLVWHGLRCFALSPLFRLLMEAFSFLGGFPPEQAACFHEYIRDQFSTPRQTQHLLSLILALDDPPPSGGYAGITQDTVIVSGFPDFMTGVYHSLDLAAQIRGSKHVMFSMGSHFLLLEWPELLAQELVTHLMKE